MKRWLRIILAVVLGVGLAEAAFCQERVALVSSGREICKVDALTLNGSVYIDVQKTARKLGAGVEFFARSKQAKVTARGFYAILTASLKEVILNAKSVWLEQPAVNNGGSIMAPVSFFLLPQFQQAVEKEISFKDGVLYMERPFDIERMENVLTAQENRLVFLPRRRVTWKLENNHSHMLEIRFPSAVIKRDERVRLKTDLIATVSIDQKGTDAVVKVTLGKKAKKWNVEEHNGKVLVRVGKESLPALSNESDPDTKPVTPKAQSTTPDKKTETVKPVETPSILDPEEFGEVPIEDDADPTLAITAAPPTVIKPAEPSKPAPVVSPAPALAVTSAHKKMRIVVDPGHGGKDPGAVRSRTREKDLNLAVSKELYKLLKKGGFEVKITRENDTFIALSDRSKTANNFKADLFVSVHTNASKNKSANGFQVYFRSEKATDKEAAETAALENEAMQYEEVHYNFVDALLQSLAKNEYINESSKLAGYVRNAVYKQPGIGIAVSQNNSVRQANFYVLKGVQSPAILVEMGYISSQKDRGRLTQGKVQKNMAQGIYNGIYEYAQKEGWIN